jgi:hypothetical protein
VSQHPEKSLIERIEGSQLPETLTRCLVDLSEIQGNNPMFIKLIDELTIFSINAKELEIKTAAYEYLKEAFSEHEDGLQKLIKEYKSAGEK